MSGEWLERAGRRFARFTTTTVVARPGLWRLLRPLMRVQFDRLAPVWDRRRGPESLIPLQAALATAMVEEARRLLEPALAARVRYEAADAEHLPFEDASFDLVVLLNMIPFFEELARVTALGGALVLAYSSGPETPIYTPPGILRSRLEPLGFGQFEEIAAGDGTALLARRTARA
jgi:SAM-dependent methyltransferase